MQDRYVALSVLEDRGRISYYVVYTKNCRMDLIFVRIGSI
jgi:hypothetical protein